jgi:hypothetical protein
MQLLIDYVVKPVWLATVISAISYALYALPTLFQRVKQGRDASFVNGRDLALGWLFTSFIFIIFLGLLRQVDAQAKVWQVGLIALAMAVLPIYGWVLQPLTYMWSQSRFTALPTWEAFLAERTGLRVRVFVINKNFYNAFATGALPFARVILVGRPLLDSLPEDELKAIMLHEVGHIAHHDLPRLCLLSMLIGSASAALFCWVQLWMDRWQVGAYWVGIYGALQYAIGYGLITGLITKRMEYRADAFAAAHVGAGTYAAMLTRLDQLTDGLLTRGNMTHPTLEQRLRHVAATAPRVAQAA